MMKRSIFLVSLVLQSSLASVEKPISEDRIAGALIGASLGDAFGHVTGSFDTLKEIVRQYGQEGISSIADLKEDDWVLDAGGLRKIPHSFNTMISSVSCSLLTHIRRIGGTQKQFACAVGQSLTTFFGEENIAWQPNFAQWYRARANSAVEPSFCLDNCFDWASQGAEDRIYYGPRSESDASAFSRVWPIGIVYGDNLSAAQQFADYSLAMTHTHATARSAMASYVTCLVYLMRGESIDKAVQAMILEAEKFDRLERRKKRNARKIWSRRHFKQELIAQEQMLTSDLIRYAARAAQEGISPEEVFGYTTKRQENNRSYRGFLLGYQADEAVAAAVYLLVRDGRRIKTLISQASLACGNAPLIASLAGALSGAHLGLQAIKDDGVTQEIDALENGDNLRSLASAVSTSQKTPSALTYKPSSELIIEKDVGIYYPPTKTGSRFNNLGRALLALGGFVFGGYLLSR